MLSSLVRPLIVPAAGQLTARTVKLKLSAVTVKLAGTTTDLPSWLN